MRHQLNPIRRGGNSELGLGERLSFTGYLKRDYERYKFPDIGVL